jgi:hypothetical protein
LSLDAEETLDAFGHGDAPPRSSGAPTTTFGSDLIARATRTAPPRDHHDTGDLFEESSDDDSLLGAEHGANPGRTHLGGESRRAASPGPLLSSSSSEDEDEEIDARHATGEDRGAARVPTWVQTENPITTDGSILNKSDLNTLIRQLKQDNRFSKSPLSDHCGSAQEFQGWIDGQIRAQVPQDLRTSEATNSSYQVDHKEVAFKWTYQVLSQWIADGCPKVVARHAATRSGATGEDRETAGVPEWARSDNPFETDGEILNKDSLNRLISQLKQVDGFSTAPLSDHCGSAQEFQRWIDEQIRAQVPQDLRTSEATNSSYQVDHKEVAFKWTYQVLSQWIADGCPKVVARHAATRSGATGEDRRAAVVPAWIQGDINETQFTERHLSANNYVAIIKHLKTQGLLTDEYFSGDTLSTPESLQQFLDQKMEQAGMLPYLNENQPRPVFEGNETPFKYDTGSFAYWVKNGFPKVVAPAEEDHGADETPRHAATRSGATGEDRRAAVVPDWAMEGTVSESSFDPSNGTALSKKGFRDLVNHLRKDGRFSTPPLSEHCSSAQEFQGWIDSVMKENIPAEIRVKDGKGVYADRSGKEFKWEYGSASQWIADGCPQVVARPAEEDLLSESEDDW